MSQEQHTTKSERDVSMQDAEIPAQPTEEITRSTMGLITIICFLIITLTMAITVSMITVELLIKGGLSEVDPVHVICLAQIIFGVMVVAGLLILEG